MAGLFSADSWNTKNWETLGDVPIVGEAQKTIFGDPEAIKAAYEKAIGLSQQGSKDIREFLMGQQGKAQQFYGPIQKMFQGMYGTQGLMPQQNTGGMGPIQSMYGGG